MTEAWKPVLDYEDFYEASNLGNIRRSHTKTGRPSGRLCRPANSRGYSRYVLSAYAETRTHSGHKLVWEAFNGRVPNGMQINHKNGVKNDNRLENLEVCTPSENTRHGFRVLGRAPVKNPHPGSRNGRARLSEHDIPVIRKRLATGEDMKRIAEAYNVNHATIWQIAKGRTWRHVN